MTTLPRQHEGFLVVGGSTVVIDVGGLRFVSDPTFDNPTDYGGLRRTRGPAIAAADVADADVVLVSHADHIDNLDASGRAFALRAPRLLTNPGSARILDHGAVGLAPWSTIHVAEEVTVTAVPAVHGPVDGEPDERGFVNCEVTGFVIQAPDSTIYLSGDHWNHPAVPASPGPDAGPPQGAGRGQPGPGHGPGQVRRAPPHPLGGAGLGGGRHPGLAARPRRPPDLLGPLPRRPRGDPHRIRGRGALLLPGHDPARGVEHGGVVGEGRGGRLVAPVGLVLLGLTGSGRRHSCSVPWEPIAVTAPPASRTPRTRT